MASLSNSARAHPPRSNPPLRFSSGPRFPCTTPSTETCVVVVSFMIAVPFSLGRPSWAASPLPRTALRDCWDMLLRRYHARLSAAGVRGYDLHQCRFHYRQSLLYTLAPGIAMLGQMQLRGGDARGLADTLVLRTLTHASDLDAFATL